MHASANHRTRDVAIVAPQATELYVAKENRAAGGAEMQAYFLAQALADHGLRVAHVVHADRRLPARAGRVEIFQLNQPKRTLRGLLLLPAFSRLLGRINPGVVIQRTIGIETAVTGVYCRATGRRFVFSSSSDHDVNGGMTSNRVHARLALSGMAKADAIVVQSEGQRDLVADRIGRSATVIPSFGPERSGNPDPEAFLWVGRLVGSKSPMEYLDVARRVPEARFRMVATSSRDDRALERAILERAASLPNLELVGPQSRDGILHLFERAVAIVSTSRGTYEGFPNTFLEAWSFGVPALSLECDPDGVIERHRLGAVAGGEVSRLADLARAHWNERGSRESEQRIRRYLRARHSPEIVGAQWADLVRGLLA